VRQKAGLRCTAPSNMHSHAASTQRGARGLIDTHPNSPDHQADSNPQQSAKPHTNTAQPATAASATAPATRPNQQCSNTHQGTAACSVRSLQLLQ
jgi:hypothetical protein